MDTIIATTIITALCSSGFTGFITFLIQRHDKKNEEKAANKTALSLMVRGLCHDKILYLSDKYIERGGITAREKANLKAIYDPYHSAGGNGDCQVGWETCDELPVITEGGGATT